MDSTKNYLYFVFQSAFMQENEQSLKDIQHIKTMMERSSRFISLSGLSGIAAGICAIIGAAVSYDYVMGYKDFIINPAADSGSELELLYNNRLFWIAAATFTGALVSAFIFTWLKSKKQGIPMWGNLAYRLLINVSVPLLAGGIFLFRLIHFGTFGLVAPGCLIFYGLALVNASKYTLNEIRYLGYLQVLLGIINLWFTGWGIYFWAAGFGVLHIVYGTYMWYKYERN
ncbi:MAG TPA: hypothetical protein PKC39_03025 [Ferruginibacter sp.]|nr:hypothetical protein [Ferruginibacter sp.]HMP19910.1 hypothetical protein [Ferruginibacter sp.]